ncbi:MAG: hypothetical protein HRT68_03960, partial [Flavobacteriaceae bacterium]|nr:hypothetical protein [Flavobacteriaceae bacterium]
MSKNKISSLQKYIWLDQKLTAESPKYNIGGYAIIKGNVDFYVFKKAISAFSNKHTILKSIFREDKGNPFTLLKEISLEESVLYLEKDSMEQAIDLIQKDFKKPFNLDIDERLFNICLIKTSPNTFVWYTKLHHLIADGYSFQLLFNGVSNNYKLLIGESILSYDNNLKEFRKHIKEEEEYYKSKDFLKDKKYWENKYTAFPELVYSKQYQDKKFYDKELYLSEEYFQKIQLLSKQEGVS